MAFEKLSNSIDELNDNVKAFTHSNAEYYKLLIFKQTSRTAISLVKFLIVAFSLSTALAFVSLGIAFAISAALEEPSSGFFIVGGFYLILIVLFVIFGKKPLTKFMLKKFSREIFNEEN
ncbi:phage holin family protein [Zunongwangia sp. HRR-M8]|uniref:phage holin family protein n=1 Tax=Zunongwangia sp. HRR-M8 TaxID=3015170 RepID=UPI0022DD5395|nr:phage holin family protein [Zunongwangia sp. HRR-M8]WBL22376.1 phage holin family protein [Zunongwangia sp. HRR-M8]